MSCSLFPRCKRQNRILCILCAADADGGPTMCTLGAVGMEEDKATLFRLGPQGEVPNYMREMGTRCC